MLTELPIHFTTAIHPVKGNTPPITVQANKAVAPVETNFIDLPKDNQRDDGKGHQSGQMKESIQQLIKHNFPSSRSHATRDARCGNETQDA